VKDIPAFPLSVAHIPGVQEGGYEMGMTLRDYFAAKAMQALLTRVAMSGGERATEAYRIADAMLAAREAK
jgi:hypothetical protein